MIKFIDHFFDQKINIYVFVFSGISFIFLPFLLYFRIGLDYFIYFFLFSTFAVNIGLLFLWIRMFYVSYWTSKTIDMNSLEFFDQDYFTLRSFVRGHNLPVRAGYHILEMLVLTRRLKKIYSSNKVIYDDKSYLPSNNYHIIYKKV